MNANLEAMVEKTNDAVLCGRERTLVGELLNALDLTVCMRQEDEVCDDCGRCTSCCCMDSSKDCDGCLCC